LRQIKLERGAMNKKTEKDQREFSRVDLELLAKVKAKDEEMAFTGKHNVSMKGLFVKGKTDWSLGTECEVHLALDGQNPPVDIKVKARVQRITEEGIAFLFTEVSLEAYEHLHNLVLLNTGDTKKVELEFKNHLGLKKK
jgi:hypothetical protein